MMVMMMVAVQAALAASPTEVATQRLVAYGPHVARYVKEDSGEPAMEVIYNSPDDITVRVFSPDGVFALSVDQSHMRLQAGEACASLHALPILEAVQAAGMEYFQPVGTLTPRLNYRVVGDQVDLNATFLYDTVQTPFSWLAELSAPGVSVAAVGKTWQARMGDATWVVSQQTGLLDRFAAGERGLRLDTVKPAPNPRKTTAKLPRAADVCVASTDALMEQQIAGQIRLQAYPRVLSALLSAWDGMDGARRQAVAARQAAFWQEFFAAELPAWAAGLGQGAWRAQVVAGMADVAAFQDFQRQLPPAEQGAAVDLWQQAWYARVGQDLVEEHVGEIEALLIEGLVARGVQLQDPAAVPVLLGQPLRAAALAEAEAVLLAPLGPLVAEGAAALRAAQGL